MISFKCDLDVNIEWTSTITKYLKDQLNKLNDYHQSYSRMTSESEIPQKQWHYTVRLTDWLYEVCSPHSCGVATLLQIITYD